MQRKQYSKCDSTQQGTANNSAANVEIPAGKMKKHSKHEQRDMPARDCVD